MTDLSRRGLLGLMAAAPVAASVPAAPKSVAPLKIGIELDDAAQAMFSRINETVQQYHDLKDRIFFGEGGGTLHIDHPPVAIAADDEGPGAPDPTSVPPLTDEFMNGAPAPDESLILQHARAC